MDHPVFFNPQSIAHAILLLSFVVATGILIGRLKLVGVSLGIGGVLFSGLAFGHFGFKIDPHLLEFVREFGLVFFVYTVGIQIGPLFFSSFKKDGFKLNIIAASIVSAGFLVAIIIRNLTGIHISVIAGIMSGAVTNTPGLGAAQQILSESFPDKPEFITDCGLGYAVTYPFGILGIILGMIAVKKIFTINLSNEKTAFTASSSRYESEAAVNGNGNPNAGSVQKTDVAATFIGISIGVLFGMIAVKIPGFPVPLKLGIAGGPLLVALFLGKIGRAAFFDFRIPKNSNLAMREVGITLFLACVGLHSGTGVIQVLNGGDGLWWMILGVFITFVPIMSAGIIARLIFKLNYLTICGLLAGSMTDPPALSFAEQTCESETPAVSYAGVYALTMFLRILFAQLLIIIFL